MIVSPYEENTYLSKSSTNLTLGQLRRLSRPQFDKWAMRFRKEVVHAWDKLGVPIIGGKPQDGIIADFKSLANYDVKRIERPDDTTGKLDCLINPRKGAACVQFFPTLLKTKDITRHNLDGPSIYKYFADDRYAETFRSTLYKQIHKSQARLLGAENEKIADQDGIFKFGFSGRPATNFPPAVAKYLYLRFTEQIKHQKTIVVYDPSAGWGGRILGAMACCKERSIHYVGTDPNSDNWLPELKRTRYDYLAGYFNGNVRGRYKGTYEIFRKGSEEITKVEAFKKYKGHLDLVFTSPPYFAAEGYSDEATQSYIKFPSYEEWLDGFLAPTLKTCVDYLKEERWLLWNISDVVLSSSYLPLESDTIKILESLGLEYRGVLKMALATAPGGNRDTKDGVPRTKNYCRIDDNIKKFEPILTFWKPIQKGKKKAKGWVPTFRWLLEQEERGQDDLTPIEEGDGIWLKRDDLYETAGVKGGKARSCWHLAHGAKGLVTAGSRESPQVNIVAHIAAELGIGCRCHVPSGPLLPEVEAAKRVGADIVQHRPGYNSVIKARARSDARSRGWREIPFGMECDEAIEQTALQVKKIPKKVERIVVPVGSGMSLAGILHGLYRNKLNLPVLGVVVGADPTKRLDKYAPANWRDICELKHSDVDYHKEKHVEFPIALDPIYEAKCVQFLRDGDLFWIVGIRQSLGVA